MVVSREDIAGPLRELIASGKYAAGEKLPSVRDLAATYSAARGTANAALHQLAREGLVSLRDKSSAVVLSTEERDSPQVRAADVQSELAAIRDAIQVARRHMDDLEKRVDDALSRVSR